MAVEAPLLFTESAFVVNPIGKIAVPIPENQDQSNPEKRLQGKCGVFGVVDPDNHANLYLPIGQLVLQDRGRDSAGGAVLNRIGELRTYSGMGSVNEVLTEDVVENVLGNAESAIGHNRYTTKGGKKPYNAQPIHVESVISNVSIALVENGNHYEDPAGRDFSFLPEDASDTVKLTHHLLLLTEEYPELSMPQIFQLAFSEMSEKGAGADIALVKDRDGRRYLIGTRDTRKTRPLVLGKLKNGGKILASESAAIDKVGGEYMREIEGGEIIVIDEKGNIESFFCGEPRQEKLCVMEFEYFTRPDSFVNGARIQTGRTESGYALARRTKKKRIKPTRIVPVLDSGLHATNGIAQAYGLPLTYAIQTEHYFGRTFTMSNQEDRINGQDKKHRYLPDEITDEDVLAGDDSTVRTTTSKKIVYGLRSEGRARKVHAASASSPFTNGCDRGINIERDELPAAKWRHLKLGNIERNIAKHIGADSMTYLPIEDVAESFGTTTEHICYTCQGGLHPIKDGQPALPQREKLTDGKPKVSIFISGSGTNLQKIIDGVEEGGIEANISSVISNDPNAFGLTRAENHGLVAITLSSKGKTRDLEARREYEQTLLQTIDKNPPDVIVLAGWMMIMSDEFLIEVQNRGITVLNLHPALLTAYNANKVKTTRGNIPVIRGAHAIRDAWEQKLPVSGVTVHQVLPGQGVDVGPIILKEEVRRRDDDTLETFEKRIHEAEYRVLPTALKRVIHALKYNINVSNGTTLW